MAAASVGTNIQTTPRLCLRWLSYIHASSLEWASEPWRSWFTEAKANPLLQKSQEHSSLLSLPKIHQTMKRYITALAAIFALSLARSLQAAPVVINSPNHGETLSESSMLSQGLHWNARLQQLTAVITFSNEGYASDSTQRHDDTLAFVLPGVRYDQAENVFYAISRNGERTPIAKFGPMLFGKVIQLLPGATVYVEKSYGNISIKLVKAPPNGAPHWKEVGVAVAQS